MSASGPEADNSRAGFRVDSAAPLVARNSPIYLQLEMGTGGPCLAFHPESAKLFQGGDMNTAGLKCPRVLHLSWGHIEVEGHPPFKDAKVFPGGAREWDWRDTGTRHVPGIQPADVRELIEHGAKVVVLSNGIWERLQFCPETLEILAENGIEVEVLQTEMAVERFNNLREGVPVGGLFHSTC